MKNYFLPIEYAVYRQTVPGWKIDTRTIPNHELVFVMSGTMYIVIRNKKYELHEGDLIYFKPDTEHKLWTKDEDAASFYGIHCALKEGSLPFDEVSHWESWKKYEPLLSKVVTLWYRKQYLDDWELALSFSRILLDLSRENNLQASPSGIHGARKAIDYIHSHPEKAVTMEEMCRISGMKKTCLSKNFQIMTGKSPVQYALELRLEHAKALLTEDGVSVREAAYKSGFKDEFYFSRAFGKKFGMPPSQFKKNV